MKENIETKDVQRTEYLDKNGLDMLWAKVKENTHNQVEVERNRATTQEDRIIETKADKSELHSSYVSNSTFTALQEKVAANTDAISDKQDAGNYLPYERYASGGGYDLPYNNSFWVKKTVDNYITSTVISPGRVIVHSDQYDLYLGQNTTGCGVSVDYGSKIHSYLNYDSLIIYHYINNERYIGAKLNKEGIFLLDGDNNHVLTSHGSTIDITQYVLKSVYDEKIAALEARIAALEAKHTETA